MADHHRGDCPKIGDELQKMTTGRMSGGFESNEE
jgi:hypothetical protein